MTTDKRRANTCTPRNRFCLVLAPYSAWLSSIEKWSRKIEDVYTVKTNAFSYLKERTPLKRIFFLQRIRLLSDPLS